MKTSKFCAGATIGGREVESINQAIGIATTGTPWAFLAKPDGSEWDEFDLWFGFGLMVLCFVSILVEDWSKGRK